MNNNIDAFKQAIEQLGLGVVAPEPYAVDISYFPDIVYLLKSRVTKQFAIMPVPQGVGAVLAMIVFDDMRKCQQALDENVSISNLEIVELSFDAARQAVKDAPADLNLKALVLYDLNCIQPKLHWVA